MSKLDELIRELCPDGVEYKKLGDVATVLRGGSFQKKDYTETGVPCIHYGQIYVHYNLFVDETISFISEETAKKQKFAEPGDIVMAVTSENIDDVCKCVAWLGDERVAVSGHAAIIHHTMNPRYLVYFLHSSMFYKQKTQIAHGTKVIEVTPSKLCDIVLPVPPLPVQEEIVRILDSFTALTAELTAELTARKKQYEYYSTTLLSCYDSPVRKLEEVCYTIADGDHQPPPKAASGVPFITISNIKNNRIDFSDTKFVPQSYYDGLHEKRKAKSGDILYSVVGSFGIPVCIDFDKQFVFQRHIAILRPNPEIISSKFLYYCMRSNAFFIQADSVATGAAQRTVGLAALSKLTVPVPAIEKQNAIVAVLERFDALCNDITVGLPAEIEARQKQYEYYRDKLLTFTPLST